MPVLRPAISWSFGLILIILLLFPSVSFSQVHPTVVFTYRGDINEDGRVNIFDLLEMLTLLSSEPESERQQQIAGHLSTQIG